MNDSPMSYDMLQSIAVQVSQELYRQAEYAPRGPSYRDALAWVRTRLAREKKHLQSDWTNLSHAGSGVQPTQS